MAEIRSTLWVQNTSQIFTHTFTLSVSRRRAQGRDEVHGDLRWHCFTTAGRCGWGSICWSIIFLKEEAAFTAQSKQNKPLQPAWHLREQHTVEFPLTPSKMTHKTHNQDLSVSGCIHGKPGSRQRLSLLIVFTRIYIELFYCICRWRCLSRSLSSGDQEYAPHYYI